MPGLPPIHVEAMTCALGNEKAIQSYIGHLVAIYKEVYRCLREDGVAWIVMGDSFAGSWGNYAPGGIKGKQRPQTEKGKRWERKAYNDTTWRPPTSYYPQGNLMMVPHRLALALQADGWIVRNDVVWHKKSPMPESVSGWRWQRHRIKIEGCSAPNKQGVRGVNLNGGWTKDTHPETRRRAEWQDCPSCPKCEANPADCPDCLGTGVVWPNPDIPMSNEEHHTHCRANPCPKCNGTGKHGGYVLKRGSWRHTRAHEFVFMLTKRMNYWSNQEAVREPLAESSVARMNQPTFHTQGGGPKDYGPDSNRSARKMLENLEQSCAGRNPRSVLTPKPENFLGAHFAVYPSSLIKPLIKAACPDKCCPECGKGWAPMVERETYREHGGTRNMDKTSLNVIRAGWREGGPEHNVLGHRPTCECGCEESILGTVLDPFGGAGTTGLVCERLGLNSVLIEISLDYAIMSKERITNDAPLLNEVEIMT